MELTKREVVGSVLLLICAGLFIAAAGISDVESLVPDTGLASGKMELALFIAGCITGIAALVVLTKKGGRHGKRRAKKVW